MAKGIYARFECFSKDKYLPPVYQKVNGKWYVYPSNSSETSTTVRYFRSFAFSEDIGITGTLPSGSSANLNDGSGSWANPFISDAYMYITPTEAPIVSVFDSSSKYAEVMSSGRYVSEKTIVYSKGSFLTDIKVDLGSLPDNGKHTDGYWYMFVKMASDLKVNDTGLWRDTPTGWANVNGMWQPQSALKANVQGIFK